MTAPTARQVELARRRAYEAAREAAAPSGCVPGQVVIDYIAEHERRLDSILGRTFVDDLQAELKAARLTMLREGWF